MKLGVLYSIMAISIILFTSCVTANSFLDKIKDFFGTPAPLSIDAGCQIIHPTWKYYLCEEKTLESPPTYSFVIGKSWFGITDATPEKLACNKAEIIDRGSQSCQIRMTSTSGSIRVFYKLCTSTPCTCDRGFLGSIGGNTEFPNEGTINVPMGSVIAFCANDDPFQTMSANFEMDYKQKYLTQYSWSGRRDAFIGAGCNIRGILSSNQWNSLPSDLNKDVLALGQSVNFIDVYISIPVVGNYIENSKYGDG